MTDTLLDSKSKQKALLAFIQHPNRYFSIKELSLRTGIGSKRMKAILSSFQRNSILKVMEKHRVRFYQIDRHSSLYAELHKIFGSQKDRKTDFLEKIILKTGKIKLAALSGVFIGLPRAQADLLLVGKISNKRLEKSLRELEKITLCEINYSVMSEEEYLNRLYSFDWFVKEIMEKDPVILLDKISKTRRGSRSPRILLALTSGNNAAGDRD